MTKLYNCAFQKDKRKFLRSNSTKPEKLVWQELRNNKLLGLKFRRQYSIGNYIADFCCPALKLIIEIDGAIHGEGNEPIKDLIREKYLKNKGFYIKRYTAKYVLDNLEGFWINLESYCKELMIEKNNIIF